MAALRRVTWWAAGWAGGYALYRAYYAAGGTLGMLGVPHSRQQFELINAVAAVLLAMAAALPILLRRAWSPRGWRPGVLVLCWLIAVACMGHAAVGVSQRVSSLAGWLTIDYPFWLTIDERRADLQALLWNEPWFFVQGWLWYRIAWVGGVRDAPWRAYWAAGVITGVVLFTIVGLLSAFGVIGRFIIG